MSNNLVIKHINMLKVDPGTTLNVTKITGVSLLF